MPTFCLNQISLFIVKSTFTQVTRSLDRELTPQFHLVVQVTDKCPPGIIVAGGIEPPPPPGALSLPQHLPLTDSASDDLLQQLEFTRENTSKYDIEIRNSIGNSSALNLLMERKSILDALESVDVELGDSTTVYPEGDDYDDDNNIAESAMKSHLSDFDLSDPALLVISVNVLDVNDNVPKFIKEEFSGGFSTDTEFGAKILDLKVRILKAF